MTNTKPRKVKARITRTVTEIAFVLLDRDGNVEEFEDTCEEIDCQVTDLHNIISVISIHP